MLIIVLRLKNIHRQHPAPEFSTFSLLNQQRPLSLNIRTALVTLFSESNHLTRHTTKSRLKWFTGNFLPNQTVCEILWRKFFEETMLYLIGRITLNCILQNIFKSFFWSKSTSHDSLKQTDSVMNSYLKHGNISD